MALHAALKWAEAFLAALLINLIVLAGITVLSQEGEKPLFREDFEAVFLTKFIAPSEITEPERKIKDPDPPDPPRTSRVQQKPSPADFPDPVPLPDLHATIDSQLNLTVKLPEVERLSLQAAPKTEFEFAEVDQAPRILKRMPPVYPMRARRMGLEGKVVIRFLVDVRGNPTRLTIVESDPEGVFDQSVIQAVSKWKFKPGIVDGSPVGTWMRLPLKFRLGGG